MLCYLQTQVQQFSRSNEKQPKFFVLLQSPRITIIRYWSIRFEIF